MYKKSPFFIVFIFLSIIFVFNTFHFFTSYFYDNNKIEQQIYSNTNKAINSIDNKISNFVLNYKSILDTVATNELFLKYIDNAEFITK